MNRRALPISLFLAFAVCVMAWLPQVESAERPSIKPFVVGGENANIADFPYQVGLYLTMNEGRHYRCGGALIGVDWILTAGHCLTTATGSVIDPAGVEIRTGASEFSSDKMIKTSAVKVFRHPDFVRVDRYPRNDVGLIRASRPIPGVAVRLNTDAAVSGTAVVAGWGRTSEGGPVSSILQKATLPLIEDDPCNQSLQNRVTAGMLCAGNGEAGGPNTCQGDSGGPLVQSRFINGIPIKAEVGIVSWGLDGHCARKDEYGVFTRVSAYADWIASIILKEDDPAWTDASAAQVMNVIRATQVPLSADEIRLVGATSNHLPSAEAERQLIAGLNHSPRQGASKLDPSVPARPGVRSIMDTWGLRDRLASFASDSWHDVILLKNGTVFTLHYELLPDYTYGRQGLDLPGGLTNVVAVGAGNGWSYALKRDGTLASWNSKAIDIKNEREMRDCHPDC